MLLHAGPASAQSAGGYKPEYSLSFVSDERIAIGRTAKRWRELVAEKTEGRVNIRMYPNASLVKGEQTREATAVRQGVADMAVASASNWSSQFRALSIFSLPFFVPDIDGTAALIRGDLGNLVRDNMDKAGIVTLAWGSSGYRQLSNALRPVQAPADLKGMRIRVIGLPLFMDFFKALGAAPVQLNLTGVPDALQKKAIDGQDNPLSVFTGFKFNEMGQKYLTVWNYPAEPIFIAVNKNVWNNWSREDQQQVRAAAEQAISETAPILTSQAATQAVDETVGQLEQAGVQVTRLTNQQRAAFKNAASGVLQNWSERIGQDLITIANADIKRGPKLPPASDPAAVPASAVPASPNPEPPPVDEAAPAASGAELDKAGQSTPTATDTGR
ncbi:MAG: TRAP transporter substrate-binding protein DctP [Advenella sp.]|uniref:TRAP transporter substrate-binding protein DctP n=1 Tax=Advenella sp. TaxID=1872388 RepID=UPI0018661524